MKQQVETDSPLMRKLIREYPAGKRTLSESVCSLLRTPY